ncbi:MAG: phage tail tube protein [bacterium]|nr:phage tail tube protein [bacterium]
MALSGKSGTVYIGANRVAEIAKWSLDCKADNIDVTSFDSEGWKEFLAGLKEWSGSFEGNFKPTDTNGQAAIINAWLNGTPVSLECRIDATKKFAGSALVSFGIEMPVDAEGSFSCDYQGTAALTPTLT